MKIVVLPTDQVILQLPRGASEEYAASMAEEAASTTVILVSGDEQLEIIDLRSSTALTDAP